MRTGQGAPPTRGGSVFVGSPVRRLAPCGGQKKLLPSISLSPLPRESTWRGRVTREGALQQCCCLHVEATMAHPHATDAQFLRKAAAPHRCTLDFAAQPVTHRRTACSLLDELLYASGTAEGDAAAISISGIAAADAAAQPPQLPPHVSHVCAASHSAGIIISPQWL